eukprot:4846557-Ditylum_brightwellii.AAC.1
MQIDSGNKKAVSIDDGSNKEMIADNKNNQDDQKPFLQLARDTVERLEDTVFATWYDNQGKSTKEYSFRTLWQEA